MTGWVLMVVVLLVAVVLFHPGYGLHTSHHQDYSLQHALISPTSRHQDYSLQHAFSNINQP